MNTSFFNFLIFKYFFGFLLINLLAQSIVFAQNPKKTDKEEQNLTLESDTLGKVEEKLESEDLALSQELTPKKRKKKEKKRRREYLGLKTSFTSAQDEDKLELFRIIPIEHLPRYGNHHEKIYYFNPETQSIKGENYAGISKKLKKKQKIYLLHGNYQLIRNGELRAEGFYNKGLKHDEWFEYDGKGIITERIKYDEGFTKETKISYYDDAQTKVKEVIPMVHGRKQGKYLRFWENGMLAEEGVFENNQKIRIWSTYFESSKRLPKDQYEHPTQWYDNTKPKLLMEWDDKGKTLFDINKGGKQN